LTDWQQATVAARGSNRTIVGLKLVKSGKITHTGGEAAIAPLWD